MTVDWRLVIGWLVEVGVLTSVLLASLRRVGDRSLLLLTLGSFALRLLMGEGLFMVSALRLPLLADLQIPGGFWKFGPDALGYHREAQTVAAILRGAPAGVGVTELLAWPVGVVYWVFGETLAHALVLNAALGAGCAALVFLTGLWGGLTRRAAIQAAALVAFWPSSFAWSGQLLKEPLEWFGILAVFAGCAGLLRTRPSAAPPFFLGMVVLIAGGTHLVGAIQFFQAATLTAAIGAGLLFWTASRPRHCVMQTAASAAVVLLAMAAGGFSVLLWRPFPPPRPLVMESACRPATPLLRVREAYRMSGGATQVDPGVILRTCGDLIRYIPRSLSLVFIEPLPHWWGPGASVGSARYLSGLDAVLLWVLLPGSLAGIVRAVRRSDGGNAIIMFSVLLLGTILGLIVTNFGTLFRLRLQILLPAAVLAADGWDLLRRVRHDSRGDSRPSEEVH